MTRSYLFPSTFQSNSPPALPSLLPLSRQVSLQITHLELQPPSRIHNDDGEEVVNGKHARSVFWSFLAWMAVPSLAILPRPRQLLRETFCTPGNDLNSVPYGVEC